MSAAKDLIDKIKKYPKGSDILLPIAQIEAIGKEVNGNNRCHYFGVVNEVSNGFVINGVTVRSR